jgi:hypothetical protein
MNGGAERTLKIDLSFLPRGSHQALIVRDRMEEAGAVLVETREVSGSIELPVRASGGFVVRLDR